MDRMLSTIIILALLIFDLLEPIFRSKKLYFSIKIDQRKDRLKNTYENYLKKVMLITLPIGVFLWYYYPIEENLFVFFCGFLMMVFLNLFFYFVARKEIKKLYDKK